MKLLIITILSITVMAAISQTQSSKRPGKSISPFVCNMSVMTPAERELHQKIGEKIFGAVREVKELRHGYALRLSPDSSMIESVARFIEKERLCCPFMKFTVEVGEEHGPLWVNMTGREGAKDFIREEFDLDSLIK